MIYAIIISVAGVSFYFFICQICHPHLWRCDFHIRSLLNRSCEIRSMGSDVKSFRGVHKRVTLCFSHTGCQMKTIPGCITYIRNTIKVNMIATSRSRARNLRPPGICLWFNSNCKIPSLICIYVVELTTRKSIIFDCVNMRSYGVIRSEVQSICRTC